MALQTSGAISLDDIQTEFGGTNPINLSEYYGAASGIPTSGSISLSDFYGASAATFSAVLYSGNSSTQTIDVGFSPDLIIGKRRTGVGSSLWENSIRGDYKFVYSTNTGAEITNTVAYAFEPNGFSIGGSSLSLNNTGDNYVAWCWKAGGTAVTNTDGTLTSTVSAGTDTGISIVTWTGTGGAQNTIGHGLGVTPELVIHKNLSSSYGWVVIGTVPGYNSDRYFYAFLNTTAAAGNGTTTTYNSTSTSFKAFLSTTAGSTYQAICLASIAGVSKISTYTGNGSTTSGPIVTTGFAPSFILFKRLNGTSNWMVLDKSRDSTNPNSLALWFDIDNAETNNAIYNVDFNSNGFQVKGTSGNLNISGATYLYAAFA